MLAAYLADAGCICVLTAHVCRSQLAESASRADPIPRLSYHAQRTFAYGGEHYFQYRLQIQCLPSYAECIKRLQATSILNSLTVRSKES